MQRTRLGLLLGLLLVALVGTVLAGAPANAASGDESRITSATGVPFGLESATGFAVNMAAEKAIGSQLRSGSGLTAAICNQPSYMQVFDPPSGQRLITLAPGNTISVNAFTILLHQGVVLPNTRAIFFYRWDGNTAGFDYYTTFAEGNCVMRQEPNPLSAQNFPVQNQVSVSICFVPWEINQVICGPLGFINRTF